MIREGIVKLSDGHRLTYDESQAIMKQIMNDEATDAQIAAFLTALKLGGETAQEIAAFAATLREYCRCIRPRVAGRLVDTCGTGGDRVKTFNISTAAAFVVAGAGAPVAKHGNRSVTSRSGSADVLEALGLRLDLTPRRVEGIIESTGIGFIYAPVFHPAMRRVVGPRREIGIRTVFNVIGPLTNPANAEAQLLGVYDARITGLMAEALRKLGSVETMVVHGLDGLDEISTIGRTKISWLRDGEVIDLEVGPEDFGVKRCGREAISGYPPAESALVLFKVLYGVFPEGDPRRDIVLANASAGLVVAGRAASLMEGMELAREAIDSGAAYGKLRSLVEASGGTTSKLEELERRNA